MTALDHVGIEPSTNIFSSGSTCIENIQKEESQNLTITDKANKEKVRKAYWNPLGRIFFDRWNLIYCLGATANFKIIVVMGIIPSRINRNHHKTTKIL